MILQDDQLRQRLSTIHDRDPRQIRRELLHNMREMISCEACVYFDCVESQQEYFFSAPEILSSDTSFVSTASAVLEGPALDTPWLPPNLDPKVIDNFVRIESHYSKRELQNYDALTKATRPMEICDQLRAVIYDDQRFLGWIGFVRCGREDGRFSKKDIQRARRFQAQIKSTLAVAESLQARTLDDELVGIYGPDGRSTQVSAAFAKWQNSSRRHYIRQRVREADAQSRRLGVEIFAGSEIRLVRLDGAEGVRYLVNIDRAERMRLNPRIWLTDRQIEIAEYAAAGATGVEISDTLDLSAHTVKTHLKNIYRRLDIGCRAELAAVFADPE